MKFGDKLCKLRKKEGLSQEELGDKLNVTRQTVSKWELGQSKPDTDKLIELCNLLGVNVNDLMDDNIELNNRDRHIDSIEVKPRKWLLVVLIIVGLVISIVLINKLLITKENDKPKENTFENFIFDAISNDKKVDTASFNGPFELYSGSKSYNSVKSLLDRIIINNKKNEDHTLEIVYKDTTTKDPEEIKNMKENFTDSFDYEVSIDYDSDGYANKITIEEKFKDVSVSTFNIFIDDSGSKYGVHVRELLDRVIDSNKKYPQHQVNVIYSSTNTTNEEEIRNLKSRFGDFKKYEVIINYDDAGYVKEIKIQ